jgi:hypothetical protein
MASDSQATARALKLQQKINYNLIHLDSSNVTPMVRCHSELWIPDKNLPRCCCQRIP